MANDIVPMPELEEEERQLAEFVKQDSTSYAKNLNNVVLVTNRYVYYLKSRFTGGWEIVKVPLSDLRSLTIKPRFHILGVVGGFVTAAVGILILGSGLTGEAGPARTNGRALILGGMFLCAGAPQVFGALRRVVIFQTDDKKYRFQSRPFKYQDASSVAKTLHNALQDPATHGIQSRDLEGLSIAMK